MSECKIEGCSKKAKSRGWCDKHYMRWIKYGDPNFVKVQQFHGLTLKQRLAIRTKRSGNCIEWTGYLSPKGYGFMNINTIPTPVHRIAWELENGVIPEGLFVLHKCDNSKCVNVKHLFLGTQSDNMIDCYGKKRNSTWHSLSEADVVAIRESTEPSAALVKKYKVRQAVIWHIRTGRTHRDVPGADDCVKLRGHYGIFSGKNKLTDADVLAIRNSEDAPVVLQRRYKVTYNTIWRIRTRKSWTHLN